MTNAQRERRRRRRAERFTRFAAGRQVQIEAEKATPGLLFVGAGEAAEITAAAADAGAGPKLPTFKMVAYNGGQMNLGGWYWPVVVDLSGLRVSSQTRPILYAHDPDQIVGHTERVDVSAKALKVSGVISGTNDKAREVVATAANGFVWQASIGADPIAVEFVERGGKATANGRTFAGPVYVVRQALLREVSFLPLGADDTTSAEIAAQFLGESAMSFAEYLASLGLVESNLNAQARATLLAAYNRQHGREEHNGPPATTPAAPIAAAAPPATTPAAPIAAAAPPVDVAAASVAAVRAESARVAGVQRICASQPGGRVTVTIENQQVDLATHAINAGWSVDMTELYALRAGRAAAPAIHSTARAMATPNIMAAAICQTGRLANLETLFDAPTLEAAHTQFRGRVSLQDLLLRSAWANGWDGGVADLRSPGTLRTALRAAFSTSELGTILTTTGNAFLLEAFNFVESTWRRVAKLGTVSDLKTTTRYRLTANGTFEKVTKDNKLPHGTLGQDSFTVKADTYGKMFGVTREDIINDALGALTELPRVIGRGAGVGLNEVVWAAFLDNSSFFSSGHANYFEGSATNLQSSSLQTAEQKFMDQVDANGKPVGITPAILLVPTALSVVARELYGSQFLNTGGSSSKDKVPNSNVFAGKYRPEVSSYLGNSAFTGYSVTAWYLLADPNDVPTLEVAFLNGQQEPVVEVADADFDELGINVRGYYDFGAAKGEYRGGVKSKGAA